MFLSLLLLAAVTCVAGQFAFDLPAPLGDCMVQLTDSLDAVRQPGVVAVVSPTSGQSISVNCLHDLIPEWVDTRRSGTQPRAATHRFFLDEAHYTCEEGAGTVCNGR